MKLSDDLSPKWIYLKGCLFLVILIGASLITIFAEPTWHQVIGLLCVIWSSARLYYFMFYVIENYVDKRYRFSGIWSFVMYLFRKK